MTVTKRLRPLPPGWSRILRNQDPDRTNFDHQWCDHAQGSSTEAKVARQKCRKSGPASVWRRSI